MTRTPTLHALMHKTYLLKQGRSWRIFLSKVIAWSLAGWLAGLMIGLLSGR